jgi:xanthine dehydrogenase small subunit
VLERLEAGDHVARLAVNSCIMMLGQVDGLGVRTVEGVASPNGDLHPLQAAMMQGGGTQCGFCTPGFIMAGYAFLADETAPRDLSSVHDALAGNLCRCTGYRPIVAAMQEAADLLKNRPHESEPGLAAALRLASRSSSVCFQTNGQKFFAPRSWAEALELRARYPEATILSGGTDLGLLVSQKRQHPPLVIHLGTVPELVRIEDRDHDVTFGAAVTYAKGLEVLCRYYPTLRTYLTRLGSAQIRNMGTLGGNLGTASPIGDMLPILLALGANLRVGSHARGRREIAADDFFLAYRKIALEPDELIEAILVPKPAAGVSLLVDKISKRRDQDISTICAAYRIELQGDIVHDARLAFGGMAAVPKRARSAERALTGKRLDLDAADAAGKALMHDFEPLSDWRGSAEYRLTVARNLIRRLYWRLAEPSSAVELDEVGL